jgi:hypothetical protein
MQWKWRVYDQTTQNNVDLANREARNRQGDYIGFYDKMIGRTQAKKGG